MATFEKAWLNEDSVLLSMMWAEIKSIDWLRGGLPRGIIKCNGVRESKCTPPSLYFPQSNFRPFPNSFCNPSPKREPLWKTLHLQRKILSLSLSDLGLARQGMINCKRHRQRWEQAFPTFLKLRARLFDRPGAAIWKPIGLFDRIFKSTSLNSMGIQSSQWRHLQYFKANASGG